MISIFKHPSVGQAYQLVTAQQLPACRDDAFAFFSDAFQLQRITPPWLRFSILTPPPIDIGPGVEIDYRLRLHGIPVRWRTRITVWKPPKLFVDEQIQGPYRFWRHEHAFYELNSGTLVRDQVDYAVPGGGLVHRLLVRPDLKQIFQYRRRALDSWFNGRKEPGRSGGIG